jgi:hypothetical protein
VNIAVSAPTTRRTVLVLGRSASATTLPTIGEALDALVVLAIGWPLSDRQRALLDDAETIARRLRVVLDAHLVASAHEAAALVDREDRLLIDAKPRESRRITRALARSVTAPRER